MTGKFVALTLGCTALLLAACSQTPAPTPASGGSLTAGSPYAGGQQYPWRDRLDAPSANPYADGHAYPWTSPAAASSLNPQTLNAGQTFLSELQWTSATSGWGPVEPNRSNGEQGRGDGKALTVGGRVFDRGLGVHAASEIRYALGSQCSTFSALVGIDDEVGQRGSAQFRVYGDGKLLFDSGLRRGGNPALALNVSVAGVKELRLSVSDGGDNNYYDHADWAQAAVECAAAPPTGDVFLSDLPYVSATNGWGPVESDRSNGEQGLGDGRALTIGGRIFGKGLGVHAFSTLSYDLGGHCSTFSASLGLDDEVGDRGSVVFQVYGDDRKLYDSGVLRGSDAARSVRVGVSGVKALKLIVTDAGDSIDYDHADWADARLSCASSTAGPSGTLDPSFGQGGVAPVGGQDAVLEPDNSVLMVGTANGNFTLKRLKPDGRVQQVQTDLGGQDGAFALTRQPDGRIVVVGSSNGRFAAARYNTDLSLDMGFGLGGKTITAVSSEGGGSAYAVALQPDGKIVAAGTLSRTNPANPLVRSQDLATVRYTAAGQVDPTFGVAGVSAVGFDDRALHGRSEDVARAVVIQPDGKIVLAGQSDGPGGNTGAVLTRLTAAGALNQTFGGGGAVGMGPYATFNDVAQEANGTLVAVGYEGRYTESGIVKRYSPDGRLLKTGYLDVYPGGPFNINILARVLVQPDGKLLITTRTQYAPSNHTIEPGPVQTAVGRLNPDLSPDTSFGNGGAAVVPVTSPDHGEQSGLAITPLLQPNGKIVVVALQTARVFP